MSKLPIKPFPDETTRIDVTTFQKGDHKIMALQFAVQMHDPIPLDGSCDVEKAAKSVLRMADLFLEHLRSQGSHMGTTKH